MGTATTVVLIMPVEENTPGYIELSDGLVLGLKDVQNDTGMIKTTVVAVPKSDGNNQNQKWMKGKPNDLGFCTIIHANTGRYLTANMDKTTVELNGKLSF